MTETTTLRELALALSIDQPDATLAEHLAFLTEEADALGLDTHPDAALSDVDADTLLVAHAREAEGEEGPDPDAAYDRVVEAQLGL